MQKGIEIKSKKGNFWPTKSSRLKIIWFKSSTLAVSINFALRLLVNVVSRVLSLYEEMAKG